MPNYRRNLVPGGTFFFTVTLRDRRSDLLTQNINALRDAVRAVRTIRPFVIDAFVVLPEHLHCIWTLPEGDRDFPARWRGIKSRFGHAIGQHGVWQNRYWEHTIRDERDYAAHFDYVHFNPVKHGLVVTVSDWPHSTFRHAIAAGHYPTDWAGSQNEPELTGEP
jgi:putative transposase